MAKRSTDSGLSLLRVIISMSEKFSIKIPAVGNRFFIHRIFGEYKTNPNNSGHSDSYSQIQKNEYPNYSYSYSYSHFWNQFFRPGLQSQAIHFQFTSETRFFKIPNTCPHVIRIRIHFLFEIKFVFDSYSQSKKKRMPTAVFFS